ncbi:MAG TPA: sugar transferase, partial [Bdellovibrionota bacterium]
MKSTRFEITQKLADFLAVLVSFGLGFWLYLGHGRTVSYQIMQFLGLGALAGFLFIVVFQSMRLYETKVSLLQVVETRRLLLGWVLGSLILFAMIFFFRFLDLSRLMVATSLGITFVLLVIERSITYQLHLMAILRGGNSRSVAIYGAGVVGRYLYKRIYHSPGLGLHVVGFLDDDNRLWGKEVHIGELLKRKNGNVVLGGFDHLLTLISERGLKEVFVALPNATYERNMEIVQACRKEGLSVSVVPPTYGHQMHNIEVEDIGGIPVLREKESRPYFLYPFLKRTFDLVVSAAVLVLLSPVFLLLCLSVRFDSPGPIFFRQRRVGLNGKEFDFFKFRTMYNDTNPYALTPRSAADPRITRFGRWLRRSSLDEFPQLWNVLRGEMSIV